MKIFNFIDNCGTFRIKQPENISYLYFPLASETGLKSSVTPNLGGDSKIDQETFLLEPVSAENLHNNRSVRNFWFARKESGAYSSSGASAAQEAAKFSQDQDNSELTAGFMWHTLKRTSKAFKLESTVTSFIPVADNVEIMYVSIRNLSEKPQELTPYAAIPIYGRSADNIRDHRNVTSLLHRIQTTENGVWVRPTMSFDERGHRINENIYYVIGYAADGSNPECFYPTVESFIGEGGTYTHPRAVYENIPGVPPAFFTAGKEAMGAFRFKKMILAPNETAQYIILIGVEKDANKISTIYTKYNTADKIHNALLEVQNYWKTKVNVGFYTGDSKFDNLMKWICFQPFLRRLFGCSFLPHHDYGRGGRGWRDLWQDCLSLLFMDSHDVGQMIEKNYGGVRIDGTNATIIGEGDGNFIADRNGIARVWMDHALWPLMTTRLYIDQTGDIEILNRHVSYFKDAQIVRGTEMDRLWSEADGNKQLLDNGEPYTGSILEHLLIQQLTAFYEVGEHNIFRLRDADWNDALDMAAERGESVAFTCAYAENISTLAELIRLSEKISGYRTTELIEELTILLEDNPKLYSDTAKKMETLKRYTASCRHYISGKHVTISLASLAQNLEHKADWLRNHLRSQEWMEGKDGEGWFNSYYDNHGQRVEGYRGDHVRMMLTGQVFAIMGHVATTSQIEKIVKSADRYLYQKAIGGYRLNTDFHELKSDMGRMFGFAYGEKENGAVFSHMSVMYANALYRRGFVKEGWKALSSLADTALNFSTSRIYPGIPEYFRSDGRGMYSYLTGAASWFMMTMINEVFGVCGKTGDLSLRPKLLNCQFDKDGNASVSVVFAGKSFLITYENKSRKEYGNYTIASAKCDRTNLTICKNCSVIIPREMIEKLPDGMHRITVQLV